MQISLKDDLPFISIFLSYAGQATEIYDVLIDTGSVSTVLAADVVATLGITPAPTDELRILRGVGGTEAVFSRIVDFLRIGDFGIPNFEIEIGGMDYGFAINGILGMDFLTQVGAIIDLNTLSLESYRSNTKA
ncbi:conserved protein of unknown function [Candidatus Promineifilum breve]|uniref:Peptidase A2 domain-containing protein n=1 Tax=Candidatus Promineifilum breve TaxID=1806508 RepID=A0A160T5C7_9CHLR|nr:retropepsin-like aspartic protease [Candidatus Promineifilum breve]CUS04035.2 conserved protein of unknown function [Candidatus Promineifilum breve]